VDLVLDVFSWFLIVVGGGFSIVGGIGLMRMPDLYTRLHAASLTDTLGAIGLLTGLMLQAEDAAPVIKLILVLVFLLFTGPVATHALAGAALRGGVHPKPCDDRTGGYVPPAGATVLDGGDEPPGPVDDRPGEAGR